MKPFQNEKINNMQVFDWAQNMNRKIKKELGKITSKKRERKTFHNAENLKKKAQKIILP